MQFIQLGLMKKQWKISLNLTKPRKFMKILKILPILTLSACSYNGTMGVHDEFEVSTRDNLWSPSVTLVKGPDGKTNIVGGQSIASQLSSTASSAVLGYFLSSGLEDSGDQTTLNNGNSNANSLKSGDQTSINVNKSNLTNKNLQQQGQTLGGHHNDGLENNIGH